MGKQPVSPSDPPGAGKIEPTKGFEKETRIKPEGEKFKSYMEEPLPKEKETKGPEELKTPMDLAKAAATQTAGPSLDSLLGQIQTAETDMGDIKNSLHTPNLKFKHSQQRLLENKLTEAKSHIEAASKHLGLETLPSTKLPAGADPIMRFLGMISDGENQLLSAKKKLEEIKTKGKALNPADLMLIQVKLSQAQQEIEYSSVLLHKVISALQEILRTQL